MAYYAKAALWYFNGSRHYTKSGYEEAAKHFKSVNKLDLNGQSFLITGGSTGIGRSVALNIAKEKGTFVHVVCRNKANGEKVIQEINQIIHPDSKAFLHIVDLSEPLQVLEFTKDLIKNKTSLNVLINNAGILLPDLEKNKLDFEKSFMLNVVGTYLLTENLADHLIASSKSIKPRVITVSSGGMYTQSLDPFFSGKNEKFDGISLYAQHKRQQIVLTDIWADKYPKIQFSSMHPGWVDTPGVEFSLPSFYNKNKDNLRTTDQGADTIIWLATSKNAIEFPSGSFFFDRKPANKFLVSSSQRYDSKTEEAYLMNLKNIISEILSATSD